MYKKAQKQNWVPEEIDLSEDKYNELTEPEKKYLKNLLAFFTISDGIVIENLALNFLREVEIPEAQFFYIFQAAIEGVHCVSGSTVILTDKGYNRIDSLLGTDVNVWNGDEFSKVTILKTSESAQMYKVNLSNGSYLKCTSGHKWIIRQGDQNHPENCKDIKIETKDLKKGDVISIFNTPIINGEEYFPYAYTHGFFCGDGTYVNKYPFITLYGEKKNLIKYLEVSKNSNTEHKLRKNNTLNFYLPKDIPEKYKVPINSDIDTKLKWLAGYADADGCVKWYKEKEKGCSIQIISINLEFLRNIKLLLQTLGIQSSIKTKREETKMVLPDGSGGKKLYNAKKSFIIYISTISVNKLIDLGFNPNRLKIYKSKGLKESRRLVRIESIEKDTVENSYCFNEPLKHNGVFNGILTGQSETYGLLVDTYIKDPIEKDTMFNAVSKMQTVADKANWAIKWIESKSFEERLVAFACVEGIAFSSTFAGIFWFRSRNKMLGLGNANELIIHDENVHYEFANHFYKNYVSNKLDPNKVKEIILECCKVEEQFVKESMPSGLDGLNQTDMVQYVRYVTDTVLLDFGLPQEFGVTNPLNYMARITLNRRGNFFESRGNNDYSRVDIPTKGNIFNDEF